MEDLIKRQREIEEAPDTMIINGIEYQKVVPPKEELTLTNIIRLWEVEFTTKWEKKENRNCDLYNQEIERLVRMIESWIPPEKDLNIYKDQTLYANDAGWNNYRRHLVSKLRPNEKVLNVARKGIDKYKDALIDLS